MTGTLFPRDRCAIHGDPIPCFRCVGVLDTLMAARDTLFGSSFESGEGVNCPCCSQRVQLYRRTINAGMAATLLWLCGEYARTGDWVDIPKRGPRVALKNREYARLRYWGLIVAKVNEDTTKRDSGLWRPLEAAYAYARERLRVPRVKYVFNGRVRRESADLAGVRDALGTKFDYSELMGWDRDPAPFPSTLGEDAGSV